MEQALDAPVPLQSVFPRMHAGETAYYIADSWLVDRASELANCEPPLVTVSPTQDAAAQSLATTVALTSAGRAVLNGKADRVRHSGIDRWLGGVHVHGRGPVWRRSARTAALVHV